MNRTWLYTCLLISLALLAILNTYKIRSLNPFFRSEKVLKLKNFEEAKKNISKEDIELLKLWESILTGRAAPLSKVMKKNYQELGLNHIFTPSGFHLSSVLFPFLKIFPRQKHQLFLILLIGGILFFLPGMMALKRMILIKGHQKLLGLHSGFIFALSIDIFFGSFQFYPLSFTYSFLFLSIIYSGANGLSLIIWFYMGQVILAYFQNNDISPLLLFFSPLLNLGFAFIMPILFLLSFPLWSWQLNLGLVLLGCIQKLVNIFSAICLGFPSLEIHTFILVIIFLLILRKWKFILVSTLFISNSLNSDYSRAPGVIRKEFVPEGKIVKTLYQENGVVVVFEDGRCRMKLVRGFWYENCSPKRRSSRRKIN
ncbi:MAG: hypothetical protein ACLGHN_12270 [Bacteriovoracia bacterium]